MTAILKLSEKVMGKAHTTLTIVNRADQIWSKMEIYC